MKDCPNDECLDWQYIVNGGGVCEFKSDILPQTDPRVSFVFCPWCGEKLIEAEHDTPTQEN